MRNDERTKKLAFRAATIISREDEDIREHLDNAFADIRSYAAVRAKEYHEIGVDVSEATDEDLLWATMADQLIIRGYAASIWAGMHPDKIIAGLNHVAEKSPVSVSLGAIELDGTMDTEQVLPEIADALWEQGYALGCIRVQGREYVLFIQELNMVEELVEPDAESRRISFDAAEGFR